MTSAERQSKREFYTALLKADNYVCGEVHTMIWGRAHNAVCSQADHPIRSDVLNGVKYQMEGDFENMVRLIKTKKSPF